MKNSKKELEFKQKTKSILIFMLIIGLVVCSITILIGTLPSFYSKVGWKCGESVIRTFLIGILITIPLAIFFEKKSR